MKKVIKITVSMLLCVAVLTFCFPVTVYASEVVSDETYADSFIGTTIIMLLIALGVYTDGSSALQQTADTMVSEFKVIKGGGQPTPPPHFQFEPWNSPSSLSKLGTLAGLGVAALSNILEDNKDKVVDSEMYPDGKMFLDGVLNANAADVLTFSNWSKLYLACDDETMVEILTRQSNAPTIGIIPNHYVESDYGDFLTASQYSPYIISTDPLYCEMTFSDINAGAVWDSRYSMGGYNYSMPNGAYWTMQRYNTSPTSTIAQFIRMTIYVDNIAYYADLNFNLSHANISIRSYTPLFGYHHGNFPEFRYMIFPVLRYDGDNCVWSGYFKNFKQVNNASLTLSAVQLYQRLYGNGEYEESPEPEISVDPNTGIATNNYYETTYNPAIDYSKLSEAVRNGVETATISLPEQAPITQTVKNLYYEGDQITKVYPETKVIEAQQTMTKTVIEDVPSETPTIPDKLDTPKGAVDKMKMPEELHDKFPFCIPWDFVALFTELNVAKTEPVWEVDLHLSEGTNPLIKEVDDTFTIDLTKIGNHDLSYLWAAGRWLCFGLFLLCLMLGTKGMISG